MQKVAGLNPPRLGGNKKMDDGSVTCVRVNNELVDVFVLLHCRRTKLPDGICQNLNVKQEKEIQINRPCAVVWQLLLPLLEIVGGRLCPVEQEMSGGENNNRKKPKQVFENVC